MKRSHSWVLMPVAHGGRSGSWVLSRLRFRGGGRTGREGGEQILTCQWKREGSKHREIEYVVRGLQYYGKYPIESVTLGFGCTPI